MAKTIAIRQAPCGVHHLFDRCACTIGNTMPTVTPATTPPEAERQLESIDSAIATPKAIPMIYRLVFGGGPVFGSSLMASPFAFGTGVQRVFARRPIQSTMKQLVVAAQKAVNKIASRIDG
jgi:hypothetical protein